MLMAGTVYSLDYLVSMCWGGLLTLYVVRLFTLHSYRTYLAYCREEVNFAQAVVKQTLCPLQLCLVEMVEQGVNRSNELFPW